METKSQGDKIQAVLLEDIGAGYFPHSSYEIIRRCYDMNKPCCAAYSKRINEIRYGEGINILAMKSKKNHSKHWFLVLPPGTPGFTPNVSSFEDPAFAPHVQRIISWDISVDANT